MANMRTRCELYDNKGNLLKTFDSLTEATRATGVHQSNIRRAAKDNAPTARGRYYWRITSLKLKHPCDKKPVWQWLPDGTFCAEYASCAEAERITGASARHIAGCAKQEEWSVGGYRWTFKGTKLIVEPNPRTYLNKRPNHASMKPVQVIAADWRSRGAGLEESLFFFPSISEACSVLNLSRSMATYVGKVLKGERKVCGGYLWFDGNATVTAEQCDRLTEAIEEGKRARSERRKKRV